jgi:hypothetical protein
MNINEINDTDNIPYRLTIHACEEGFSYYQTVILPLYNFNELKGILQLITNLKINNFLNINNLTTMSDDRIRNFNSYFIDNKDLQSWLIRTMGESNYMKMLSKKDREKSYDLSSTLFALFGYTFEVQVSGFKEIFVTFINEETFSNITGEVIIMQ